MKFFYSRESDGEEISKSSLLVDGTKVEGGRSPDSRIYLYSQK